MRKNTYQAKDYIVIQRREQYEDWGRGLLIGEFDTYEEALEFMNSYEDTSDMRILGPRENQ